ncbi:MAG: TonB-dependent receptor, partial [Nostoc sp.]
MKPRLHCATTFYLRLMGTMPVALSVVLYPAIVKAELTSQNLLFPDSPSQADKGENLSPNLSSKRGEALNSSPTLVGKQGGFALVFPDDVKSQVEYQADQNKVAEKSIDSNSPHLLGSSEQQVPPLEFPSTSSAPTTDTSIPDVQPTETKIQPFQPATSIGLPRGLRKIAGIEDKGTRGQGENLPVSPTPAISTAIKILTPTADSVVDVPATKVIVQFPVGSQVELRVNGTLVDSSLVGRTESDTTTNLVTQTWYGVSLKEGNNAISAQA